MQKFYTTKLDIKWWPATKEMPSLLYSNFYSWSRSPIYQCFGTLSKLDQVLTIESSCMVPINRMVEAAIREFMALPSKADEDYAIINSLTSKFRELDLSDACMPLAMSNDARIQGLICVSAINEKVAMHLQNTANTALFSALIRLGMADKDKALAAMVAGDIPPVTVATHYTLTTEDLKTYPDFEAVAGAMARDGADMDAIIWAYENNWFNGINSCLLELNGFPKQYKQDMLNDADQTYSLGTYIYLVKEKVITFSDIWRRLSLDEKEYWLKQMIDNHDAPLVKMLDRIFSDMSNDQAIRMIDMDPTFKPNIEDWRLLL